MPTLAGGDRMGYLDLTGLRYLWGNLKAALHAKQDTLIGAPGQVVGFGSSGRAEAQSGWSNPNLLDNWYFADPINQRGQTEYDGAGYGIDRWVHGKYTLQDGGLDLNAGMMYQRRPHSSALLGKTVTFSVLRADGRSASYTFTVARGSAGSIESEGLVLDAGSDEGSGTVYVGIGISGSGPARLIAAKLELGPVQTLALQDTDERWTLNDAPPDQAVEMAKCQRYQQKVRGTFSIATNTSGEYMDVIVSAPITMRIRPSFTLGEVASIYLGGRSYAARDFTFKCMTGGGDRTHMGIRFACDASLPQKTAGIIGLLDGFLDANL